eukprot:scaffold9765_cov137-Skeletonema_dohrnii-CCMP3373.AAC.1
MMTHRVLAMVGDIDRDLRSLHTQPQEAREGTFCSLFVHHGVIICLLGRQPRHSSPQFTTSSFCACIFWIIDERSWMMWQRIRMMILSRCSSITEAGHHTRQVSSTLSSVKRCYIDGNYHVYQRLRVP